jgi:hypothetical protein
MSRLLLQALAILACMPCASLVAQDLGPLLPPGQSPQRSPVLERYSLEAGTPGAPRPPTCQQCSAASAEGRAGAAAARRADQLYRTLAPSVALIVSDKGAGSGSLIVLKPAAGAGAKSGTLLTNAHVVGNTGGRGHLQAIPGRRQDRSGQCRPSAA